jgi:hypothetical protein
MNVRGTSARPELSELALPAPTDDAKSGDAVVAGAIFDALESVPSVEVLRLALPAPTDALKSGDTVAAGAILDALTSAPPAAAPAPPRYAYSSTPSSRVPKFTV